MTLQTDRPWNTTAYWSVPAERTFARMRREAERQHRKGRRRGGRAGSIPFDTVAAGMLPDSDHHAANVPLDRIVGSVGKDHQFTRSFHPTRDADLARWKRAYAVAHGLRGYDPVELYEVAGRYFVVDGHYRVSVARALGSATIQATVRRWR